MSTANNHDDDAEKPKEEVKNEIIQWVDDTISRLHEEMAIKEVEIEQLSEGMPNDSHEEGDFITQLKGYITTHKYHIDHLELILTRLRDNQLNPTMVKNGIQSPLNHYLDAYENGNGGYMAASQKGFYDSLRLDDDDIIVNYNNNQEENNNAVPNLANLADWTPSPSFLREVRKLQNSVNDFPSPQQQKASETPTPSKQKDQQPFPMNVRLSSFRDLLENVIAKKNEEMVSLLQIACTTTTDDDDESDEIKEYKNMIGDFEVVLSNVHSILTEEVRHPFHEEIDFVEDFIVSFKSSFAVVNAFVLYCNSHFFICFYYNMFMGRMITPTFSIKGPCNNSLQNIAAYLVMSQTLPNWHKKTYLNAYSS